MVDDMNDWNRLARYLAGEGTEADAAEVRRWIATDPRREIELEALRRAWARAGELPPRPKIEAMWRRLSASLELPAADGAERGRELRLGNPSRRFGLVSPTRSARWQVAVSAAAVVLCVAGATMAWRWTRGVRPATESAPAVAQEFRTKRGQRATMTLVDGTCVALGPESSMRVRIAEAGRREVELEGEAVFRVTHDSTRPFLVRAGTTVTEDLGTTFAVRAYAGEPVRVVVAEGIVAMRDSATPAGGRTVLNARDVARVAGGGEVTVEREIDPSPYLSWMEGRLVFRHAPLREVLPQVERWFDVRIVVEDSTLLSATVNGAFGDGSLDRVMRTLSESLDAAVERRGRTVFLRGR